MWLHPIHRIWHWMGIQRSPHQRERSMEGSIHNQQGLIQTNSHVLWTNQLPGHIPNDDEHNLLWSYRWGKHNHLYGWHSHPHWTETQRKQRRPSRATQETSTMRPWMTKDKWLASEPWEMRVRARPPWLLRSMCWRRNSPDGTIKGRPSQRVDLPQECLQSSQIPGLHGLLLLLHLGILTNH